MPPSRKAIVPAVWEDFYEETHIPAAVRVGDMLRVTGHTGRPPTAYSPAKSRSKSGRCFGTSR